MVNYTKTRLKLRNTQLYKLQSTAKNKTGKKLWKKLFQDEELLHELFLTTKQN